MVTLNLSETEFAHKYEIADTLRAIANAIESGYHSGLVGDVCWYIEGEAEGDED